MSLRDTILRPTKRDHIRLAQLAPIGRLRYNRSPDTYWEKSMTPISRRSFFGQATASAAALSAFGANANGQTPGAHSLAAQPVPIPEIRVAILGDPEKKVEWTDAALEALKQIGFNAIQINIAWGSRPFGEPLDLIDVVTVPGEPEQPGTAECRAEMQRRAAMAKRHGFRTIFHFGSPYLDYNPYTGVVRRIGQGGVDDNSFDSNYDVANPLVADHELKLLGELRKNFPDVDDIEVYTYDQDAWQTAEFQGSKYSAGIPLSERLPEYLRKLHRVWTEGRVETHRMWWEPWELSAGQCMRCCRSFPKPGSA